MSIIIPDPPGSPGPPSSVLSIALNRRLTKQFIDMLPVTIVLTSRTRAKKPAGGWAWEDVETRDPEIMTLVEQTGLAGQPKPVVTADGVERTVEFMLLAEWDSPMSIGDTFTHQGKDWEVIDLFYDNQYEKRAMVTARGK